MAKDVKFNIKLNIDGKEHIVSASTNVKKFAEELSLAQTNSNKFRDSLVKWNGMSDSFQNISRSIQQIARVTDDLSLASNYQVESETKLATVMRQRMGATDEEIDSIKALAAEQQKLGIIGDEVQLAGAQQIATFLREKGSMEALLPAMNNLLAQQHGLNATGQDAVSIGNMMGKVMQGQTSALTRAGITFTKAQEEVLKFGTESERAAMLAQVITDNVGEMNAELAKTDAGKAKQVANIIGDHKEKIGALVSKYQIAITVSTQLITATASLGKIISGLSASVLSAGKLWEYCTNAAKKITAVVRLLDIRLKTLTATSKAASIAIKGLTAATGVGLAITAICTIISKLSKEQEKATKTAETLAKIQKNASSQYADQSAKVKTLTDLIHDENIATDTRRKYIEELRGIIPDYNASLSEEGVITNENTRAIDAYLVSLDKKLKMQASEDALLDAYKRQREEKEKLTKQEKEEQKAAEALAKAKGKANASFTDSKSAWLGMALEPTATVSTRETMTQKQATEYQKALNALKQTKKNLDEIDDEITAIKDGIRAIDSESVLSGGLIPEVDIHPYLKAQNTIEDFDKAISHYKDQQKTADQQEYRRLQKLIDLLERKRDAFTGKTDKKGTQQAVTPETSTTQEIAYVPEPIEKLNTLGELTEALQYYQKVQQGQSRDEIVNTQRTIDALKQKRDQMQELLTIPAIESETQRLQSLTPDKLQMELELLGVDKVNEQIKAIQALLATAPEGQKAELEALIPVWEKYKNALDNAGQSSETNKDGVSAITSSMSQLGNAVGDAAGDWITWTANLMNAIATAIPAIEALTSAKNDEANANGKAAATGAAASVANIPIVGAILAVAAIASVVAAIASIPKFAKGGLAYGPTLGVFGEYSGASNNPEVVAPLDRLRSLINVPQSDGMGGQVRFRIDGRSLVGILEKESNIRGRR